MIYSAKSSPHTSIPKYIPLAVGSAFEQAQLAKKVVESFETSLHGPLRTNEAIELITTLGLFKCSQKHSVL